LGYTARGTQSGQIKVYTLAEMLTAMERLGLSSSHLVDERGQATPLGSLLHAYFEYRADILNNYVEPRLMDADEAEALFYDTKNRVNPVRAIPMNKQKGDKAKPAFLTGMVNMLIEESAAGAGWDSAPRRLTTFTRDGSPIRTLARWVDGCFPSPVNPVAVWEIKEYYYTTTFGSRVADGVYESLLDGMELEELHEHEGISVEHLLIVDSHFTWWRCGRSYLCRMVDMLHMGYVDEILFGYEVVEQMPKLVKRWLSRIASDAS
jgi:hypothetical protein